MVKIWQDDLSSSLELLHGKRVFCFGGGKIFRKILPSLDMLNIEGVVDNYLSIYQKEIQIENISVAILTFDEYVQISEPSDVIIITTRYYWEIIEQLDGEKKLEGVDCFLGEMPPEAEFDDYIKDRETRTIIDTPDYSVGDGHHFQIWEYIHDNKHAGSKAPKDVRTILESMGYTSLNVHMELCRVEEKSEDELVWRNKRSMDEWQHCIDVIPCGAIIVLQNPFRLENIYREKAILELKKKNVKIVSIVHDIESIRKSNSSEYFAREEEYMMDTSDVIVVQNSKMTDYMDKRWAGKGQIVELKIFDYLADNVRNKEILFGTTINYAGNLDFRKSPFLYKLGALNDIQFNLFGPNFEKEKFEDGTIPENINYEGAYEAEKLPGMLTTGFGLVWEGDQLDTCDNENGNYLRVNSPHKLSLYLAAGIPVVIWDKAAMAKFVLDNEVGTTISSLYYLADRIRDVTKEQYSRYVANAKKIGQRLRNGEFTKAAILESERQLEGLQKM